MSEVGWAIQDDLTDRAFSMGIYIKMFLTNLEKIYDFNLRRISKGLSPMDHIS